MTERKTTKIEDTRNIKILRVMGYPLRNSGSLERYMLELAKKLKQQNYQMHLLFDGPRNPKLEPFIQELEKSCVLHWFPSLRRNRLLYFKKSYNLLKKEKYDIVHVYFTPAAYLFSWLAFFFKTPIILRTLGSFPISLNSENLSLSFLQKIKWKIIHLPVKKMICVSNGIKKYITNNLGQNRSSTVVIYATTDTNHYIPRNGFLFAKKRLKYQQQIKLTFLGRLVKEKGIENLIIAVESLIIRYPNIRVKIVGDGNLKSFLLDLISERGLEKVASLPGRQQNILEILQDTDIYVHPTYTEGCGRSILEAMSCGVPIVASRIGGIKETVRNNVDGILVPPGSPEKIEKAVVKLIEDEEFYNRARVNARRRVTKMFDAKNSINKEMKLYRELYSNFYWNRK